MQYNACVREALILEAGGARFRFYYDVEIPEVLHITLRHGTTPDEAISVFFEGATAPWNAANARYETLTDTHALYWTRHIPDQSVIVISCFRRGD